MTRHSSGKLEFVWDEVKATINLLKHKISFMQATKVFEDPHVFRAPANLGKDGETRWRKTGMIEDAETVVTVIYTMRDNGTTTRLISARPAKDTEEKEYDDNKNQSQ